jgi:hypothetical protein
MTQGPIPFRTYVIAATLSVVVNIAAVGTFATARVGGVVSASRGGVSADASATVVLTEWPEAQPSPAEEDAAAQERKSEEAASRPVEPPQAPAPPPPEPETPRVRLGNVDAPESDSKVWLGVSKDAGTPKARPGTVDQAEFKKGTPGQPTEQESPTPNQPRPKSPVAPAQAEPTSKPQPLETARTPTADTGAAPADRARDLVRPSVDEQLTTEDTIPASPAEQTQRGTPTTDDPFLVTLDSARPATSRLTRKVLEAISESSQPKAQDADELRAKKSEDKDLRKVSEPTDAPVIAAPAPTVPKTAPTTANRSGQGGNGADRESDAFAKDRPVNVRPGQPLAGKGLSIKTVAPRWTTATRVLHRFRDPVVRVTFGRNGKVLKAAFVPGKDAGHPDVSGPLLDAIYRWTAQGEELNQIPEGDPLAGLVLEFHVALN